MTRWKVVPIGETLLETKTHYTGQFECHNMDTGEMIRIEFTQKKGQPIADAIGGLQALAKVLYNVATEDETPRARMH